MLSLLPLLVLLLVACVAMRRRSERWDIRDGLLLGAVSTALWAWAGAEGSSALHQFARIPILTWWTLPTIGLALWLFRHRPPPGSFKIPRPKTTLDVLLFGLVTIVLFLTGILALLTPPTTYDSLSYHLPRQIFWIHNQSIAQFPSFDLRQIEMPPLAEYITAQLMLLSGTDHQANMAQWFGYFLSALTASAIARDMGAGYRAQVFAALLVAFNPAAATQAENAKNDLVESLWIMALFWAAVRIWTARRCSIPMAVFVGGSLGLALLTKGSSFPLALPVCVMIAAGALRAHWNRAIPLGAAMVILTIAINAPHWFRNYSALGAPLGLPVAKGGFALGNETFTPKALASNLVRNLTLYTCVPYPEVNAWEKERIAWLHRRLGIGESDPRTTFPKKMPFEIQSDWMSDGNNAAQVHLLLGVAMVLGFRPGKLSRRAAWPAFLIPFGQMLLFALLLKWQPWHVRLQIPLVSVASVILAVWLPRASVIPLVSSLAAFTLVMFAIVYNQSKPLVGDWSILHRSREQIMFRAWPEMREPLHELADEVAKLKPRTIALGIEFNKCEYLVQRVLLDRITPAPKLVPFVNTLDMPVAPREPADCAVVRRQHFPVTHTQTGTSAMMIWVWGSAPFRIYAPVATEDQARKLLPLPPFFGWDGW